MKTIISIFIFFLLITGSKKGYPQCPSCKYQPELSVSYGGISAVEAIDNIKKATRGEGRIRRTQTSSSGPAYISARYFLYRCMSVGFGAGYLAQHGNNIELQSSQPTTVATYSQKTTSIALELCYIYQYHKYFETYSYLGIGSAFTTTETTPVSITPGGNSAAALVQQDAFTFHYSPIGIRLGGRIGAFAELGFGYKGLVSGGLSFRFGKPWWKC
ncbi:MAG: hypothetical protein H7257_10820 [Taibaiella sp.]|nr:hypothetical protein [Taibaiella sp.]